MKHLSKIMIAALMLALIYGTQSLYSSEVVIEEIRVQDTHNIDIILSENPNM